MTQPIKIQAKHHPAAKTVTINRQRQTEKSINSAKKAPAPPPNPALVNPPLEDPQPTPGAAVRQPQMPQDPKKCYERHINGALTYFNYYFEDLAIPATPADYPTFPPRSKLPVGAVGAGVLAATIASGAIISDAFNQPEAPQSNQPQDLEIKQSVDSLSPRPTTTAPEKLETGRSLSASPVESTPTKIPAKQPTTSAQQQPQNISKSLITSGPLVSNAQPLKLSPLTLNSAPRSTPDVPAAPTQPSNSGTRSNSIKDSLRSAIARQQFANPSAVAPPETLPPSGAFSGIAESATSAPHRTPGATPSGNGTTQVANLSSGQFPSPSANSGTTPFPPSSGMFTPASSGSPNQAQSPFDSAQGGTPAAVNNLGQPSGITATGSYPTVSGTDSQNRQATSGRTDNAPADRLLESGNTALNRVTSAPATGSTSPGTATGSSPLASNTSEGIQDYLNHPPKPGAEALALMPLSSRAAGEAAAKPQIGSFTVRQVNQRDYQKEWQTSNRNPQDPAIAYAFPAYGFIDYQRQVIVVLKEQPDLNPLRSQRTTPPNS
ncbi:hypothetical protein [Leptodesmis sp.]|uniref:hypothetical protein n=1 Tax=Leptodesmis sp. TaxID=3100501 RepID=UPI004053512B